MNNRNLKDVWKKVESTRLVQQRCWCFWQTGGCQCQDIKRAKNKPDVHYGCAACLWRKDRRNLFALVSKTFSQNAFCHFGGKVASWKSNIVDTVQPHTEGILIQFGALQFTVVNLHLTFNTQPAQSTEFEYRMCSNRKRQRKASECQKLNSCSTLVCRRCRLLESWRKFLDPPGSIFMKRLRVFQIFEVSGQHVHAKTHRPILEI